MRMGDAPMLRSLTTILGFGLAGAMLVPGQGAAAGRGAAPMMAVGAPAAPVLGRGHGMAAARGFGHRAQRFGRFGGHGYFGAPGPWFDGGPQVTILREEREAEKPVDRNSFAQLPTRTGIPYPPVPDPILIRLEGPRNRPVARIIRIAEAETGTAPRSRVAHAPTGALLLTVPGR
jgi:hypothetical protein